ncbi:MAG: FG-GAP-like repeat-containing protein [Thermodesulfobacteriota bacterium]
MRNLSIPRHFYLLGSVLLLFVWGGCATTPATSQQEKAISATPVTSGGLFSSGKYRAIALADLNNDGRLDIAGGSTIPGTVAIWYGDGRGGLSEPEFLPFRGDVRSLAVADIDRDGMADIICTAQRESTGILLWLNRGKGKWERGASPVESGNYEGVVLADVNADGLPDIVAANATSDDQGGIQVWFGDGKGNWIAESGPTVKGVYMDVAVGDFDRDGALDLIGAGWGTYGGLRVWFGDGTGGWSPASELEKGSFYGLTLADVNADGNPDILATTYRGGIRIYLNTGNGSFYRDKSPVNSGSFWKAIPIAVDNGATRGLLASSLDAEGLMVWHKKGEADWMQVSGQFPSAGNYYGMVTGDLNGDGRDDLCAASYGQGIKVWLGKGGDVAQTTRKSKGKEAPSSGSFSGELEPMENSVYKIVSDIPEYKIGPGDVIEITLWRGIEKTAEEVTVRPKGTISFGFVEDLDINGLTPSQLDTLLTARLGEFIRQPRIDITVKKFDSKFVTLMGAIAESAHRKSGPGKYELTGKTSVMEMITKVGGPTVDANLNEVSVRRKSGLSIKVDFYKILTQKDLSQNIILDDGDLVFIPTLSKEANRIYVFGEVEKPGVYPFSGTHLSVFDAISLAGGVTVFAKENSTKVVRGDITRPEVLSVNLGNLLEQGDQTQNVALVNKDLVYVPRSFVGDVNRFVKQITPLMRLIIYPAQVINEFGTAGEWLNLSSAP